jgi:hypothetical protein
MRELEELAVAPRGRDAEMPVGRRGGDPAARSPLEEPGLEEIRLVEVLERSAVLAEGSGDRADADRAAAELLDDRRENPAVELVEAVLVDFEAGERRARRVEVDVVDATNVSRSYGYVLTDSTGHYTIGRLPTGMYKIHFTSYNTAYMNQWHSNKPDAGSADPVSVTLSQTTTVDAVLAMGTWHHSVERKGRKSGSVPGQGQARDGRTSRSQAFRFSGAQKARARRAA